MIHEYDFQSYKTLIEHWKEKFTTSNDQLERVEYLKLIEELYEKHKDLFSMFNYHYMLKYDDSSSSSNSEKTELYKKQSDEEKTSTDQDEDIKVSTYNSNEETTSSEEVDEEINIPELMDTEPPDPYRKRKIESDSQTDDYLIKDISKVQYTTSMLTSNIKNFT
uniref:Uncharacterized protein n=1 Tax=Gossypium raimondii TaxID=29730 RepID=A0A0D2UFY2_GOSRA|nr:hypothetical protein B456_010G204600 [Gossypium raimondii]